MRTSHELEPATAEQLVAWRVAGLRDNMTTVLTAAAALFSEP